MRLARALRLCVAARRVIDPPEARKSQLGQLPRKTQHELVELWPVTHLHGRRRMQSAD